MHYSQHVIASTACLKCELIFSMATQRSRLRDVFIQCVLVNRDTSRQRLLQTNPWKALYSKGFALLCICVWGNKIKYVGLSGLMKLMKSICLDITFIDLYSPNKNITKLFFKQRIILSYNCDNNIQTLLISQ